MDPSIMKLLEEDEDETMHSGADVEAFTAALNRDIEGDTTSSQPSNSDSAALSQGSHSGQLFAQWQTSNQDECSESQHPQHTMHPQVQPSSEMEPKHDDSNVENQQQPQQQQQQSDPSQQIDHHLLHQNQSQDDHKEQLPIDFSQSNAMQTSETSTIQSTTGMQQTRIQDNYKQWHEGQPPLQFSQAGGMQISERNPVPKVEQDRMFNPNSEMQFSKLQTTAPTEQVSSPIGRPKQVPFGLLLPGILPQLDKDRGMQLQTLYAKLRKNEIPKEDFVRLMRGIVGDRMLKLAVSKLHAHSAPSHYQLQPQASAQKNPSKMPSSSGQQFIDSHSFAQLHQKGPNPSADLSRVPTSAVKVQTDSNYNNAEHNTQAPRETEHQSDSQGLPLPVSQMSSSGLSAVKQERDRSTMSIQGFSKQQQQHLHYAQQSFSMYGGGGGPNFHPFSGTNVNPPPSSFKPQSHDSQIRQGPLHQGMAPTQLGGSAHGMSMMSMPKFERPNSTSDPKRVQGGSFSNLTSNSTLQQNSVPRQPLTSTEQNNSGLPSIPHVKQEVVEQALEEPQKSHLSVQQGSSSFTSAQIDHHSSIPGNLKDEPLEKQSSRINSLSSASVVPSVPASSSMMTQMDHNVMLNPRTTSTTSLSVTNARATPKKPSLSQKKPLEAAGSSPPLSSKKQKVSGPLSDQSIEQLNDVTAVSGVNLREEEEQLFSGPKEDSRISEASRRVVQEEEERLILQRTPLQKKLAQIMVKCGIKGISNDVERCVSLCVEERLRGFISNLIRLSKQRIDTEKTRHRTVITSDVRQQILLINRKAREECEKKQAEAEKLRKVNDPEGNAAGDGDKEKDDGRVKSLKLNKEEDDKMRTTAANVAARAAVGGDDMLSKWQLMAEQARQKREGVTDVALGSHSSKDTSSKFSQASGRNAGDNPEAERRGHTHAAAASGAVRRSGRTYPIMPETRVSQIISIKDVIAVLEREPQMSKSTLMYTLYDKVSSVDAATE